MRKHESKPIGEVEHSLYLGNSLLKRVWANLAKEKEEVFEEMVHEGRQRTTGVETAVMVRQFFKTWQRNTLVLNGTEQVCHF